MDVRRTPGEAGRTTVAASGQIDLATAPQLAKALAEARDDGATAVVVDLTEVDFLDSAGVRVLVHAAKEASESGVPLYLHGAHGWVARVLEITGIADHLPPPPDPSTDERL